MNDRRIRDEIIEGALDADALAERCGAGGQCGGCHETIEQLLRQFGLEATSSAAA
ncbi:MAG: (2Fe-2S)-binding protein [Acidimicrobiales bacterium]|nr:(2Fe-2S)-binding protein [Acidimicrobiales bacterium]